MDSITHIVLGATIGEALAGRKLGKKAMLLGAIANSLPDIDFVASFWMDTAKDVWAHRGITHSFFFIIVVAPLLAWLCRWAFAGSRMSYRNWLVFWGLQLFVHIFLDAFNAYGTGWFEPFSHYRVAFHVLFVADPLYTIWLCLSVLMLLILRRDNPRRKRWMIFGLTASTLYLCYGIFNKLSIDARVRADLGAQQLSYSRLVSTPTPLNCWLWYVIAEDGSGFYTGYRSVFDHQPTHFRRLERNDSLLTPYRTHTDVGYLTKFSEGFYTLEQWGDTLVFNDLRFGEMRGWADPKARFVFHYFLQYPGSNKVIVQRGRWSGWDANTTRIFIRRIKGN